MRVRALFRGSCCRWRARRHRVRVRAAFGGRLLSVPAVGTRPFWDEGAAGGGLHHLVDTLVAVGSDAAAVSPIKIDATR